MLAENGTVSIGKADGTLQLGSCRQQRLHREGERDSSWGKSTGATIKEWSPLKNAHHRIIAANMNQSVMEQEIVGNSSKALQGIMVFKGDRLVRNVAAGHD